jgi:hypothetical protein
MNANLAYVAMTRETHSLEIITDDVEKLGKSICKLSDKQSAMEASKMQVFPELEEIRQARREADLDLGQTGDLAEKRLLEVDVGEPEPEGGIITEHEEYQFPDGESEMELA